MKFASLSLFFVVGGCAATAPAVSDSQRQAFAEVVRQAEAEGAASEPPEAAQLLREARSGFDYAQRIPMDPDHAHRVLVKAQSDAEAALLLARRRHEEQSATALKLRHQAAPVTDTAATVVPIMPVAAIPVAPIAPAPAPGSDQIAAASSH